MSRSELAELAIVVLQQLESLRRSGMETMPRAGAPLLPADLLQPGAMRSMAPATADLTSSGISSGTATAPASRFTLTPARSGLPPAEIHPAEEAPMPRRRTETSATPVAQNETASPVARNEIVLAGSQTDQLAQLRCQVEQCALCPELVRSRTQTVFGVGNVKPRVVFFGEAPGADEDRQGEPFVGRSGQLLTKIIEACGFQRSDVYIMNACKCRPPDNRTPTEKEMTNCFPFAEKQFELLSPEYIVCVGAVPMKTLFPESKKSIGQMRGTIHQWRGHRVIITYHPAYLLRNPDAKKLVWDDMKMMLTAMGLPIPRAGSA